MPKEKEPSRKGRVFADSIVEHHNDLQHGAIRPNDTNLMSHSEHTRLHSKKRCRDNKGKFIKKELWKPSNSAKLNWRKVETIFELRKSGLLLKEIAKLFNVHLSTISSVLIGKNWKH